MPEEDVQGNTQAPPGTMVGGTTQAHTNDPFDDYEESEQEPAPVDPATPEVAGQGQGPDIPF